MAHIILLGAGASYGSGDVDPYPPPLGNMLFEKLESLGKTASRLPDHLKETFKNNFEEGMKEFISYEYNINFDLMTFQRELAGYLLKFTPREENNYIKLIESIRSRRVIFASLNYDLLLELAASKKGLKVNYSNKYFDGSIRILKIHGSSNFWHDTQSIEISNGVVSGGNFDYDIPVRPLGHPESILRYLKEDSVAPAMSLFAEGKPIRTSPQYVSKQQMMWFESLTKCSKLFIIGVRVHQIDEHIWTKIAKSNAIVHYYGFPSDEPEFNDWKNKFNRKDATFHLSDFTKAISHIEKLAK
ncbi:hypothetical protein [Pantoea sp. Fr-CA_6]|uniref:hypothetical protein n=1 Tax=Pantoea sp. Fr-CA_6 TaxID=2929505 RepID=UPI00211882F5|nr:hypothetical protein [Pantoea sp. Fr-CA_6]